MYPYIVSREEKEKRGFAKEVCGSWTRLGEWGEGLEEWKSVVGRWSRGGERGRSAVGRRPRVEAEGGKSSDRFVNHAGV